MAILLTFYDLAPVLIPVFVSIAILFVILLFCFCYQKFSVYFGFVGALFDCAKRNKQNEDSVLPTTVEKQTVSNEPSPFPENAAKISGDPIIGEVFEEISL